MLPVVGADRTGLVGAPSEVIAEHPEPPGDTPTAVRLPEGMDSDEPLASSEGLADDPMVDLTEGA